MPSDNPFADFSFGPVAGGTQAGIDRVNENQSATNITAFRDANGRAVLTNTANPVLPARVESDEEKLQRLFRPTSLIPDENGQIGVKTTQQTPEVTALMQKLGVTPDGTPKETSVPAQPKETFASNPNVSLDIHKAFEQLQKTTDLGTARSLFNNIQQSLADEIAKTRQEAFKFAENKLGLPELRRQLEISRQTDKASVGWYIGIGDSPVTQKILNAISTFGQQADNEADNFLKQNSTALRLNQFSASVQETMKRIETETERNRARTEALDNARETAKINAKFTNELRDGDRKEREEEHWITQYEGLSAVQKKRIEILSQDDVLRIEQEYPTDPMNPSANPANERKKKIRLAQIARGQGKNKDYQAAINAAGTADLFGLAISGNAWARKSLLHEESAATGMSVQELEQHLSAAEREFMAKGAMAKMIAKRETDPTRARQIQAQLMLDSKSYEPEKSAAASRTKALLMLDWMSERKTEMFKNDVSSWNSKDPILEKAVLEAKKTAKNAAIENVFAAYIADTTGVERVTKIQEFQNLMRLAVAKHKDSQFGHPNELELGRYIVDKVINNRMMTTMLQQRTESPFVFN